MLLDKGAPPPRPLDLWRLGSRSGFVQNPLPELAP